ncbi:hypothetical protein [Streptomyces sp. T21Q-yed]|uniref:hypothetical protein n=1 Tax=Streptomyces sp. T21Q-yed TaxID=3018441 RepID=UPI0023DF8FB3|nr:hypothetical protein [Streptomyces sp. T21Q-yed]MDF3142598.1 hypothetical protein [Streptomyces sp. T21Q-yed]
MPASAAAYDGEDAACALAAWKSPPRDRRGLSVPDEVEEKGRGVLLLYEAEVEQEVGGLEPDVGFEARLAAWPGPATRCVPWAGSRPG